MPSGSTHDRITLWLLPWIVCGSYLVTRHGELTLLCSGGFFFSGLMFGPDLDIYSIQYKRWGMLRWLWLPYRKLIAHRSFLSHGLILGTVIRVIYLLFWLFIFAALLMAIAQLFSGFDWNWHTFMVNHLQKIKTDYRLGSIALFTGLELGSMSHVISDLLVSYSKKKKKEPEKPKLKLNVKKEKKSSFVNKIMKK